MAGSEFDGRPADRPERTVLSVEEEAVIVAFRRYTLLPLDDCLYALQPTLPHLTRSTLHRCLQRQGISRLPDVEGDYNVLSPSTDNGGYEIQIASDPASERVIETSTDNGNITIRPN